MKDFNFFNELTPKRKKKKSSSSAYLVLLIIILVGAVGGATYYFYTELDGLRNDVSDLEDQLNDPEFNANLQEAEELRDELNQVESEREQMEVVHVRLDATRFINNLLINEISLAKPETVSIDSIEFNNENINITGFGTDKDSLARFEHNLRGNERFAGPFIPNIERMNDNEYTFSLNFNVEAPELEEEIEDPDIDEDVEEEDDADGED